MGRFLIANTVRQKSSEADHADRRSPRSPAHSLVCIVCSSVSTRLFFCQRQRHCTKVSHEQHGCSRHRHCTHALAPSHSQPGNLVQSLRLVPFTVHCCPAGLPGGEAHASYGRMRPKRCPSPIHRRISASRAKKIKSTHSSKSCLQQKGRKKKPGRSLPPKRSRSRSRSASCRQLLAVLLHRSPSVSLPAGQEGADSGTPLCLSACLPVCLLACLPACLLACLCLPFARTLRWQHTPSRALQTILPYFHNPFGGKGHWLPQGRKESLIIAGLERVLTLGANLLWKTRQPKHRWQTDGDCDCVPLTTFDLPDQSGASGHGHIRQCLL